MKRHGPTYWASYVASHKSRIYFLRWRAQGKIVYAIVEVPLPKERFFTAALEGDKPFDLSELGVVLHWGYNNPPPALQHEMQQKYGLLCNAA